MSAVLHRETDIFMSVRQVAEYLQLNEKKVYALVSDGSIPATKVTGKWMFPRELIDQWMLDSSHGGLLTDRMVIAGSDDPLLYRVVTEYARDTGSHALVCYTPTGTRLGLDLLQARRADICGMHWGPASESHTRHPALLRQYTRHRSWVLIRAFRREQGLIVSPSLSRHAGDVSTLFDRRFRWALRQNGAGAQRYLIEVLGQHGLNAGSLKSGVTALSEREAASAVAMGQADVAPGARSVAAEFGLGFVSIGWESFDLVLPRPIWFRRLFQDLVTRLASGPGPALAEELTGYDLSGCGQLLWGDD